MIFVDIENLPMDIFAGNLIQWFVIIIFFAFIFRQVLKAIVYRKNVRL
jgi:tellurite resistance protein TehA-like permease